MSIYACWDGPRFALLATSLIQSSDIQLRRWWQLQLVLSLGILAWQDNFYGQNRMSLINSAPIDSQTLTRKNHIIGIISLRGHTFLSLLHSIHPYPRERPPRPRPRPEPPRDTLFVRPSPVTTEALEPLLAGVFCPYPEDVEPSRPVPLPRPLEPRAPLVAASARLLSSSSAFLAANSRCCCSSYCRRCTSRCLCASSASRSAKSRLAPCHDGLSINL